MSQDGLDAASPPIHGAGIQIWMFAILILLGIAFRFYHLDWKLYSYDETITSLRASGHTDAEYTAFVNDGHSHRFLELDRFQGRDATTTSGDVWRSLATEDPQHPPLYFLITRAVVDVWGNNVIVRRLPAAVFAALAIGAAGWLAYELFADANVAWCFSTLVALSPFHVAYAQQAREYSAWTLTICVSSALLLHSLRVGRGMLYFAYAAAVAVGLWNFTFFAIVAVSHALYAFLPESSRNPRARWAVLTALVAGALGFVPWIAVLSTNAARAVADTNWSSTRLSVPLFLGKWLFNAGTVFFDLDVLTLTLLPIAMVALGIAAVCCVGIVRRAPVRCWSFLALLGGTNAIALLLPDVLLQETRSVQSRYLTPLWLSLELATAAGLIGALRVRDQRTRRFGAGAMAFLFLSGLVSVAVASYARSWWPACSGCSLPAIGSALRSETAPTLVYVDDDYTLLELQPVLDPSQPFALHRLLDHRALTGVPHPFAIATPTEVAEAKLSAIARAIPLPQVFPTTSDPVIALLRRRAAADRHITTGPLLDRGLFTFMTRPAPG